MTWGAYWGSSEALAKEDTRLLLLGSMTSDESQYDTDLTADGGGGYELLSSRGALNGSGGRELYVRVEFTAAEADLALLAHGATDGSTVTYGIATDGSGRIVLRQGGSIIYTSVTVPAKDLSIAWSTRPDPDTGDLMSELIVYNHTDEVYLDVAWFTHGVPVTSNAWTLSAGGYYVTGPGMWGSPTNAPTKVRVSRAYHSPVEMAEDWIATRAAHSGAALETLVEPLGTSLAGVQGQWAGQPNVGYLAAHARELRGRMFSPLINETYHRAWTAAGSGTNPEQWLLTPPGASSAFKADITKLRWVMVPPGVRYAHVRVHVRSWVTSGSAVPVHLRCYSFNRPHVGIGGNIGGAPTPALKTSFVKGSLTVDDIGSTGRWLDLGILPLSVFEGPNHGWTHTTHLVLAHAFDPEGLSTNDANARLQIRAWHVRPILGEIG
jgi:hypothetical protein